MQPGDVRGIDLMAERIDLSTAAFDATKPPDAALLDQCVHCGFCLPTCPTYDLWRVEMDSPRGRLVLMAEGLEQGSEITDEMVQHFDACLGCMACVTACPSGVQYDKLIEDTRAQVERNYRRPAADRLLRRLTFALFTHPGRLRAAVPLMWLARSLGLDRIARKRPPRSRLRAAAELAPSIGMGAVGSTLSRHWPALGARRGRVGLLQGCVQRVFFHRVNVATAELLAAEGFEVHAPRLPRCCGALQLHTGYDDAASSLAKRTITAFEDCDFVVTNAAGCGSALKDYGHLLRDDPEWADRAAAFSSRVRDVTELLATVGTVSARHPITGAVAYHDACHLAHAQGIREEPRALLREIPDLRLLDPPDWSTCCGSAGIYNLLQPETADELGARKLSNLLATGARTVAAGNPGCALQIEAQARRADERVRVLHPVELLHLSLTDRGAEAATPVDD
jgi:glycolate oxidase iron-sulfur subunit